MREQNVTYSGQADMGNEQYWNFLKKVILHKQMWPLVFKNSGSFTFKLGKLTHSTTRVRYTVFNEKAQNNISLN